jgi:multidrug efflux pump subunit AcrA (membrane-fusion protein)
MDIIVTALCAILTTAQDVQAAPREGALQAQQAQRELQQAQRELQQAQREAQQAQREAQQAQQQAQREAEQAQQQAQREAQQAQREAQQAVRDMQAELARRAREGQPVVAFPPGFPGSGPQIPEAAVIISVAFFVMCAVIAIGFPIARAIARRMDKRNAAAPGADVETRNRLERIEQAVDAIAVEVERISEGQRFTTKVIAELRALPQPDPSAALGDRSDDRSAVPLSRAREAR